MPHRPVPHCFRSEAPPQDSRTERATSCSGRAPKQDGVIWGRGCVARGGCYGQWMWGAPLSTGGMWGSPRPVGCLQEASPSFPPGFQFPIQSGLQVSTHQPWAGSSEKKSGEMFLLVSHGAIFNKEVAPFACERTDSGNRNLTWFGEDDAVVNFLHSAGGWTRGPRRALPTL